MKIFQSSRMAMVFMQVIKTNSNPVPCRENTKLEPNLSQERGFQASITALEQSNQQSGNLCTTELMRPANEELCHSNTSEMVFASDKSLHGTQAEMYSDEDSHTELGRHEGAIPGYVNEMALNTMAKRELSGLQVMWKWRTVCGRPQRQLELLA